MFALKTLSPAEAEVAEKHSGMIDRFLAKNQLPADEYYDVVVFGYIRAVERWFREPQLWSFAFSTIAWSAMYSTVANERSKQKRRIKTVSLDDIIPGTDGLTYADIITEDNLDYIPYLQEA